MADFVRAAAVACYLGWTCGTIMLNVSLLSFSTRIDSSFSSYSPEPVERLGRPEWPDGSSTSRPRICVGTIDPASALELPHS